MRTPKGQSGPISTSLSAEDLAAGVKPLFAAMASDAESSETPPARLLNITRQGVTLSLPAAFWPRLALYAIGLACLAGGYILMNVALEYSDDDDENDE